MTLASKSARRSPVSPSGVTAEDVSGQARIFSESSDIPSTDWIWTSSTAIEITGGSDYGFPNFELHLPAKNNTFDSALKRLSDILIGLLLILLSGPTMIVIAALIICTSRGPIIFRQKRLGQYGKIFVVYKFRTMYSYLSDPLAIRQTSQKDSRVTPLGSFLRRTSLDELPQFFNVIAGDMSIVGPRPHALGTSISGIPLEAADPRYPLRHLVRPGITGWAQVNASRGAMDSIEQIVRRVDHDLYYLQHSNIWFDLRIMFRTLVMLITERSAW